MPGADLSRNIFSAGASAATDWGSVSANANFDFAGDIQFRRGINLDLGLSAIAQLDASFHRFLAANLSGQGVAQATVRGQVQMPLNLFDEVGVAIRLQAVAELAAGVRLFLGLELGDFLDLVDQDPRMQGVPARLFRAILNEIEIGASFYAKAALSAEAYANVVITGTALGDPQRGVPAGFNISAGAGAGLSAGAGFEVMANLAVKSFPTLVRHVADILVDETLNGIAGVLPASAKDLGDTLLAARTPLKLAVRLTYELGAHLAQNNVGHDKSGQDAVANRVVQVCLEELQRASLEGLLRAGVNELKAIVDGLIQAASIWQACHNERIALADKLDAAPDDLFVPEALSFWTDAVKAAVALAVKAGGRSSTIRICSMLWCSAQLAGSLGDRVNQAQSHVSLIGSPPLTSVSAFSGAMPDPPPDPVDQEIRATLSAAGTTVTGALRYEHIVLYLCDRAFVDLLNVHNPALVKFLNSLLGPVAPDLASLVAIVLKNGGSFKAGNGSIDPANALQFFADGIEQFVQSELTAQVRAGLNPYLENNPDLKIAIDEILLSSLQFMVAVVFDEAIHWSQSNVDPKTLTEGLSGILLGILSRCLVVTADILLAEAQKNLRDLLLQAADQAGQPDGLAKVFTSNAQVQLASEDVLELVQDALQVGAAVFGPLPDERRARIRNLLYSALDPLGGASPDTLLQKLNDPGLVPNLDVLEALATELGNLACERFVLFVQGLLTRIVNREVAQFVAGIAAAVQAAGQWLEQLGEAVAAIEAQLQQLAAQIQQAMNAAAQHLAELAQSLHQMLDGFANPQSRTTFTNQLAGVVASVALGTLDSNWAYQNVVPGFMKESVAQTVKDLSRAAVSNQVVDAILAALGGLTGQIDDLIDDIRALDRTKALAPQVRNLVLNRLAALISSSFNTVRFPIRFAVNWDFLGIKGGVTIDLGTIKVNAGLIAGEIRGAISALPVFDPIITALAASLTAFFAAEDLVASHTAEKTAIEKEHATALAQLSSARSGPKSITIERPVALSSLEGQVFVRFRLDHFDGSILATDADTPELLFVLINGAKVSLSSFLSDSGPTPTVPVSIGPHSLPGAGIRIPPAAVSLHRPANGPAASPNSLVVSGTLPLSLLRKGLNTLLIQAAVGKNSSVQASCGFLHTGAAPAGDPPPKPNTVDPSPPGSLKLPKALPPKPDARLHLSVADRSRIAAQLVAAIRAKPVQPFRKLARISPAVGAKLGVEPAPHKGPGGILHVSPLPKEVHNA